MLKYLSLKIRNYYNFVLIKKNRNFYFSLRKELIFKNMFSILYIG